MYGSLTNLSPQDISTSWRVFILFIGLIETLLFSGVLFGWADLVYLMKLEGVFAEHCQNGVSKNGTYRCDAQDNLFDLAFTVATFSKGVSFILVAFILDKLGLRASRIMANLQVTIGGFLMGYATKENAYYLYPATLLVGLGGSQIRMSNYVIANLFPNHKSTVLSLYNGAFCASATMFLVFKYIHQFGIDVETSCVLWAGISGLMIIPTVFLLPSRTIRDTNEKPKCSINQTDKTSTNKTGSEDVNSNYSAAALGASLSLKKKVYGTIYYPGGQEESSQESPFKESLCSCDYLAHVVWSCVSGVLVSSYSGSFNRWVEIIVDDHHGVSKLTELYGFCQIPMLAVPPLGGLLLDYSLNKARIEPDPTLRRKKACCAKFWFLFTTTVIDIVQYSFLLFYTILAVQLSLVTYIFARPMVNAVSVVHLRVSFPPAHFNRLLGISGTVTAIFSVVQFPLFVWAGKDAFAANMTAISMLILCLINPVIALFSKRAFV